MLLVQLGEQGAFEVVAGVAEMAVVGDKDEGIEVFTTCSSQWFLGGGGLVNDIVGLATSWSLG
jgi:hypothetical protein